MRAFLLGSLQEPRSRAQPAQRRQCRQFNISSTFNARSPMILPNGLSWPQTRKTTKPSERLEAAHRLQQPLLQQQQHLQQQQQSQLALDELGEKGEEVAERVGSISA